jgi:SAM-dependent methyltransferase
MRSSVLIDRLVCSFPRVGFTDIYHVNVRRRGILGQIYILLFGTPHLGTFANGVYLRRILRSRTFSSVLDAGCGDGTFAFYVAALNPRTSVLGVDIGEQGLHDADTTLGVCERVSRAIQLRNLTLRQLDLRQLNMPESFDLIYTFDVLEHIKENKAVLQNLYQALVPGGFLLLRIPNRVQKRILNAKFTEEHAKWGAIEHVGQHYEMKTLLQDLREIGYTIVDATYTDGLYGRLSFELSEALNYYEISQAIQFALTPLLKILRWLDTRCSLTEGDGLLVLCRK